MALYYTTQGQNEPRNNGNEDVTHTHQNLRTGASLSGWL